MRISIFKRLVIDVNHKTQTTRTIFGVFLILGVKG